MGPLQLHAVARSSGTYHVYEMDDWDYLQSQADNLFAEIWMVELGKLPDDRVLLWSTQHEN